MPKMGKFIQRLRLATVLGVLGCGGGEDAAGSATMRGSCVTDTICIDFWGRTASDLAVRRQMCTGRWMEDRCLSEPSVGGCVTEHTTRWFYRDASGQPTLEAVLQTCRESDGTFLPPQ